MKQNYVYSKLQASVHTHLRSIAAMLLLIVASFGYGQTVTLGTGTTTSAATESGPVNQYYAYTHFQVVYTAAELIAAGAPAGGGFITSFGWNVSTAPNNTIPNYSVRMAHTTATNSAAHNATALTTVYGATNRTFVAGFNMLTLTGAGFNWDGTSNLLVDICNSGPATFTTAYGQVFNYNVGTANSSRYSRNDFANQCGVNTTTAFAWKPQARFVFPSVVPCAGTPLGGAVAVSPTSGSPGSTYGVTASGYTSGTGLTYQWQYSDTNGPTWTNQGTATASYAALTGLVAPAFGVVRTWRLVVTCTASASTTSTTGTFTSSYCVPSGTTPYWITNFTTTGGLTNIANTSGNSNIYGNYSAISASQYPGSALNLSIATSSSTHYFYGWVDWNNDGDFVDAGEAIFSSTTTFNPTYTGSYTIPAAQPAGSFRLRIANGWSVTAINSCSAAGYSEYEDYTLIVQPLPACSGTPAAGSIVVSPTSGNAGSTYGITASGYTIATGLLFQWQYSDTNGPTWTNVGTATSTYAALTGEIAPALGTVRTWRLSVTCTSSGETAYSPTGTFTSVLTYCVPTSTFTSDRITNFSTTGGITNISNLNSGLSGTGYGDFYAAYSASQLAGGSLNFTETYTGGNHGLSIWVDLNKNGTFETTERLFNAPSTATGFTGVITIPGATTPGDYRMRVRAWYGNLNPDPCTNIGFGEAEDYKLTVISATPCAEPTAQATNLALTVSGTTINGAFTAAAPAPNSYLVVYNTTGTTPNPVDGTTYTIGGTVGAGNTVGDTDGNTTFSVSGLNAFTTYYFFVFSYNNSACLPNYLNPTPLTNNATTGVSYCVPAITNTIEPITLVNFAGINNTSAATTGPPAYQDFTGTTPAAVTQGLDYTITVKGNTNGGFTNYFTAFIDWNQNGDFSDPGETFPIGSINSSTGLDAKTAFVDINIPNGALPGVTRMRVIKSFTASPTDPCGSYTYGQTEDYTINISTPLPPTITSIPSDACGGSSIVITGTSLNFATSVTVGGIAATITNNTATSITATLGAGATGVVEVTTGAGTSTSTTTITVTTAPARPPALVSTPLPPGPYCNSVVISYVGAPLADVLWYWQTVPNGTSTTNSSSTYTFNTLGTNTIYLRAYNYVTGCWSILDRTISRIILSPDAVISGPIPSNGATGICFAGLGATPSLNWTSLGVGYSYDVYFGTASNPPSVGTRTTNSFPIAPGTLSPNTTYYWYIVPVSACGPSTVTPVIYSFTTNNAACYCTPTITAGNPASTAFIDTVSFLGSLNDVTNNSTFSTAPNGYQDFTNLPNRSQQAQGEGINVYFHSNRIGFVKAWVDWNRNGVFETGEVVYTTLTGTPTALASTTFGISILANRTVGFYRLRIRIDDYIFGGTNFGPCDNINNYGETEDYLFEVVPNCSAQITTITNGETCGLPLGGNVNVPLSVGVTANSTEVRWYSALTGGSLLHTSVVSGTSSSWTPSIGTTTTYYVTAYQDDNCESLVRTPIVAKVKPVANITYTPTNPESCGEDSIVTLTATGDNEVVTLIDENFESPSGIAGVSTFTAVNVNGGGQYAITGWKRRASTFIPSQETWKPAISSGFGANKFVMATSDVGDGNYDNALMSPIKSTMTFLDLNLTFRMYYSDYAPSAVSDRVTLEVSTNGGTAWTVVNTYNSSVGIGTKFELQTYDLSAYINEPNFRFRIRYTSIWTDGVAIDDIKLSGTKPLTPSFSWVGVPAVAAYTDVAATIPYVTGSPATTVYIKPTLAQLELGTYNFTATATLTNGCTTSQPITITNKSKVWKGSPGNQDWDNANNWLPNGVPTADNCVIIPTDVKIPNNAIPIPPVGYLAVAKNLTIKNGGSLELLSGNNLTVTDWIHNEGTNNFDIRNDASLLQVNNDINIGAMKMDRTLMVKKTDYTYYSSPVEGNNINTLSPGTPSNVTLKWLPTTNAGGGFVYGNWTSPGSEIMAPGKGYIVRGPSSFNATPQSFTALFNGVPRNGNITVPISRGNYTGGNLTDQGRIVTKDDDNYNLIGNPYPSAIRAISFLSNAQNNNILGSIYLWPHGGILSAANPDPFYENYVYNYNSNDYITYNSMGSVPANTFNGFIGAGQSFFVLMTDVNSASENLYFNNTMRVTNNNTQFLRSSEATQENELDSDGPEPQRIYLDLVKPDGKTNSMLVGYIEGATYESDRLFDSPVLDNETQLLYSRIGEENMIIQGRPMPLDQNDQVPLGILIPQQGIYTLAINSVDGIFSDTTQNIYLEDLSTGMIHNLKNAPYIFSGEAGRFDNRFVLRFNDDNTLSTPEITSDNDLKISGLKDYIKVTSGNSPIDTIKLFDVVGRLIADYKDINTLEFKIDMSRYNEGTFVVKATLQNGMEKTKKVIH